MSSRPPGGRAGIGVAVAFSAAAHLALFGLAAGWAGPSSSAAGIDTAAASRVEIRLAMVRMAEPATDGSAMQATTGDAPLTPMDDSAAQAEAEPPAAAAAPAARLPPSASLPDDRAQQPAGVDGYLPRAALTRGPVPLSDIDLPWPAGLLPSGRESGTFWLFIDETGVVRRFEADGPTLAPQLEEVARSSFLAARFEPGERDGQAVKSLIRIEVVFDNRRSAAPSATVVSQQML